MRGFWRNVTLICGFSLLLMLLTLVAARRASPPKIMLVNSDQDGGEALYAFEPDSRIAVQLTSPFRAIQMWRGVDNTGWMYFLAGQSQGDALQNGDLYRVSLATLKPEKLVEQVGTSRLLWPWDSSFIFFQRGDSATNTVSLYRVENDGSDLHKLELPANLRLFSFNTVAPEATISGLPDGLGFIVAGRIGGTTGLYHIDLEGQNPRLVVPLPGLDSGDGSLTFVFYLNGWIFYQHTGKLYRVRLDGTELAAFPIESTDGTTQVFSLSTANVIILGGQVEGSQLWSAYDLDSTASLWTLTAHHTATYASLPQSTPDGAYFVYQDITASGPNYFRMSRNGSQLEQITDTEGNKELHAWSPDGRWMLLTIAIPRHTGLYIMRPDGSDLREIAPVTYVHEAWWSEDSAWIYYSLSSGRNDYLNRVHIDGSQREQLTSSDYDTESWGWIPMFDKTWRPWIVGVVGGCMIFISVALLSGRIHPNFRTLHQVDAPPQP